MENKEVFLKFKEIRTQIIENTYIDASGVEIHYAGWKSTDFIDVDNADTLLLTSIGNYNAWYDSEKNFIGRLMLTSFRAVIPTIPKNAKYLRMSCESVKDIKVYKME